MSTTRAPRPLPGSFLRRAARGLLAGLRDALPGRARLSTEAWTQRHRVVLAVAVLHLVVLAGFLAATGAGARDWLLGLLPLAAAVGVGLVRRWPRRLRSAALAVGLFNASLLIIRLAGGAIEGHFHFFVMLPLVVLYQDWWTFGLAVAFVLASHVGLGLTRPDLIYGRPLMTPGQAWDMAAVHASAILASGLASLFMWRAAERGHQAESRQARDEAARQRVLLEVAEAATGATDIRAAAAAALTALTRQEFGPWRVGHLFLLDRRAGEYLDTGVWSPDRDPRFAPLVELTAQLMRRWPRDRGGGFVAAASADEVRWRRHVDVPAGQMCRQAALAACGLRTGAAIPIVVDGDVAGVLEVFSDIDLAPDPARTSVMRVVGVILGRVLERQRGEAELAELATRNDTMLRSVGEGIVGLGADGTVTFVNPAGAALLGSFPEELVGRPLTDLVPFAPAVGEDVRCASGVLHRDDEDEVPAEVSVYPFTGPVRGQGGVAIVVDTTERRAAAEAERLTRSAGDRRRHALDINDAVVQGLSGALYALELDDTEQAVTTLERTLSAARGIISTLLADGDGFDETLLRRTAAASVHPDAGEREAGAPREVTAHSGAGVGPGAGA